MSGWESMRREMCFIYYYTLSTYCGIWPVVDSWQICPYLGCRWTCYLLSDLWMWVWMACWMCQNHTRQALPWRCKFQPNLEFYSSYFFPLWYQLQANSLKFCCSKLILDFTSNQQVAQSFPTVKPVILSEGRVTSSVPVYAVLSCVFFLSGTMFAPLTCQHLNLAHLFNHTFIHVRCQQYPQEF